jgi:hypothetical protein
MGQPVGGNAVGANAGLRQRAVDDRLAGVMGSRNQNGYFGNRSGSVAQGRWFGLMPGGRVASAERKSGR